MALFVRRQTLLRRNPNRLSLNFQIKTGRETLFNERLQRVPAGFGALKSSSHFTESK
jgi:hypothetical protein